ncbi:MAG: CHAT domain-containing protein [Aureispira sp.]
MKPNEIIQQVNFIRENFKELKSKSVIDQIDLSEFYMLGEKIFTQQLFDFVEPYDALYLVPYGPLHYLPLHAMKFEGQEAAIIEKFVCAYLPSASILKFLQRQPIEKPNILTIGVDSLSFEASFVTEAVQVLEEVKPLSGQAKILMNESANIQNVKQAIVEEFNILHFSTHGDFKEDEDALDAHILLADNTRLSARDILDLITQQTHKPYYSIITMSACLTGQSENRAGDELIGLNRALIYAGASGLITTLFPVYKKVTASKRYPELSFANFYRIWLKEQAHPNKAKAFQEYILTIKNSKYGHPFFWFSFIYTGGI